MEIRFEALNPDELREIVEGTGIAYFPLGTIEWHERHLPFGVDGYISYELCRRSCHATGGCVLPTLYFGTGNEYEEGGKVFHDMDASAKRVLPGSIYFVKPDIFKAVIHQIIANLAQQGFRKVVIVSAHSVPMQKSVLTELSKVPFEGMEVVVIPSEDIGFDGGLDHAGKIETQLMMAVKPELVHISKLKEPYVAVVGEDPKKATAKEGEEQLKRIVDQIINLVKR